MSAGVHEVPQENLEDDFTLLGFAVFLSLSLFFSRFTHKNGLCFGERSNWHRVESSMFYPIKVLVYLPAGNMSGL